MTVNQRSTHTAPSQSARCDRWSVWAATIVADTGDRHAADDEEAVAPANTVDTVDTVDKYSR